MQDSDDQIKKPQMRSRTMLQASFFDTEERLRKLDQLGDPLKSINAVVDWRVFRPILNKGLGKARKSHAGRPPYDAVLMFKLLILQSLYTLSDEQTEYQVRDRLSFQRFVGLEPESRVPDAKTLWLFKESLKQGKLEEKLFSTFGRYLEQLGLQAQQGTVVDARIVPVPRQRNSRDENQTIKDGLLPSEWAEQPHKLAQKDTQARWTKKRHQNYYGYKNHIGVDVKHKFIRRYTVTSAEVHDSQVFELLLDKHNARRTVYADSAYRSEAAETMLREKDYISRVHHRAWRGQPLNTLQERWNKARSKVRARVEHVFGHQVQSMKQTMVRGIGLERIRLKIGMANLAYNMKRLTLWQVEFAK